MFAVADEDRSVTQQRRRRRQWACCAFTAVLVSGLAFAAHRERRDDVSSLPGTELRSATEGPPDVHGSVQSSALSYNFDNFDSSSYSFDEGSYSHDIDDDAAENEIEHDNDDGDAEEEDSFSVDMPPHLVFVVIDDAGYNDIGYQSDDLYNATPRIDVIAGMGIKLSNYYTNQVCSPSRSSLMTGRHAVALGMQHCAISAQSPWGLSSETKTLPMMLSLVDSRFESHLVGKWDLGHYAKALWPTERGYTSFFGLVQEGYLDYTTHQAGLCHYGAFYDLAANLTSDASSVHANANTYSTTVFTDVATQTISSFSSDTAALFLTLAYNAIHPVVSIPEWLNSDDEYVKLNESLASSGVWKSRRLLAGALLLVDRGVGSVVSALKENGMWEDTVLIVVSDNGAQVSSGGSNSPYRGEKATVWEGGNKVPSFVVSPRHIPVNRRGTVFDGLWTVSDWVPSLVSGLLSTPDALPSDFATGSGGTGMDLWDTLIGEDGASRTEVLYAIDYLDGDNEDTWLTSNASAALQMDGYKIVVFEEMCDRAPSYAETCNCDSNSAVRHRLYNLTSDPYETVDLADELPIIVKQLIERLIWHWNNTVVSSLWLPLEDALAYDAFERNDGFVTWWSDLKADDSGDGYSKPAVGFLNWL